jgi:S1-C subfamily serine protease
MRLLRRNVPLWIASFILVAAGPLLAQGLILHAPDRRAIPMLVSKTRTLLKYGTGVIVGPSTILTAEHVAATNSMEVRLPTGTVTGQAVCRARYEDLAVLQAPLPKGTPYYRVSFRTPSVGERVTVGGYPNRQWMVARGRITNIISHATLGDRPVDSPMIVFEPALHQGASGAPVLDSRGQVIGIFVASNTPSNYSIAFPNSAALRACRKFVK